MPKLEMGKLDVGNMPRNVHGKYEHMLYLSQRKYWWMMFFTGAILFMVSGVV